MTSFPSKPVDRHGRVVEVGTRVRVVGLSGDWFDQLPPDERADVESMIGEIFSVEEIDEHGHPWVRKEWSAEETYRSHFIALEPDEMECVVDDEPAA